MITASTADNNNKEDNQKDNNKKNKSKDFLPVRSNLLQLANVLPPKLGPTVRSKLGPTNRGDRQRSSAKTGCSWTEHLWHHQTWNKEDNEEDNKEDDKETTSTSTTTGNAAASNQL